MTVFGSQRRFRRTTLSSLFLAVGMTLSSAPAECFPAASACAQDARQQPVGHILRCEVNLQTVDVQVTDKRGSDVRGLTANDFTIREDGKRQEIVFFDAGAAPVTVAVLVDSSTTVSQDSEVGSS